MAHELTQRTNGMVEAAFARGTEAEGRWHGLGQDIDPDASIEEWQKAAGMDWKIKRSKVRYATGFDAQSLLTLDDQHVLFRSDNKQALGIVSAKYQPLQPGDALEFFRDLVAGNGFKLNSAGTLFGGRRYWALASIGDYTSIIDAADRMEGYLLLSTSADGTLATSVRETSICVVCNNTLTLALNKKARHEVRVSHRTKFDPTYVKAELGIAQGNFAQFTKTMRMLAKSQLSMKGAEEFTLQLLKGEESDADKVRESRQYKRILGLFDGQGMGSRMAGREGTFWGWVNAVTEFVDHHTSAHSADGRLNSAWFGKGDDMKTNAVEIAMNHV